MKLSEAIREGAELRPQGFGDFFVERFERDGEELVRRVCSCALGAAYEHLENGLPDEEAILCAEVNENASVSDILGYNFRILNTSREFECPGCRGARHKKDSAFRTISTLNDVHHWTREQIADWVETIEADAE